MTERERKINGALNALEGALKYAKHQYEYSKEPVTHGDLIAPILTAMIVLCDLQKESTRHDWTPCAEGLPEENGTYLVFAPSYRGGSSSGLDVINGIMFSRFKSGKWSIEHGYYNRPNCVIAWQPLPDPYNPDHMRDTTKKVDQFREPTKMIEADDASKWPDWKKRAALCNYEFGKED